ncbi:MAG: 3-hydroxyacyl-ACP dehydratase FabZ [Phycisphaerales bacterium]
MNAARVPVAPSAPNPATLGHADRQRTLAGPARVEGVGLFSAARVSMVIHPAPVGHGIVFHRADLLGSMPIPALVDRVEPRPRRTALRAESDASVTVETVEHLLSALAGMGVDNVLIELQGPEVPIGDGSALFIVAAIQQTGITEQDAPRVRIAPPRPVTVQDGSASIAYFPPSPPQTGNDRAAHTLELTYVLDYEDVGAEGGTAAGPIPRQAFTCVIDPERYAREIAPARTFSTRAEAEAARAAGMFKHLSTRDMLVIGEHGPIDNAYRFADEPARHKLLDLLGDLSLAGGIPAGRVVAVRSGHALNQAMARALRAAVTRTSSAPSPSHAMRAAPEALDAASSPAAANAVAAPVAPVSPPALDIRQIVTILPHRYPMLMVDRVISLESGKRAIGLKNVSINEPFFVGHYPAAPVMPGVLICEAMAQLAGLMLKDVLAHQGKVALLLAMDEVRWRRPVVPGDQLMLEAIANKASSRMADVSCRATVDGVVAAEARMKFMVVDPNQVGGAGGGAAGGGGGTGAGNA